MHVLDLEPGDEVIVPAMTFAATANAVVYAGATPVFADVDRGTLLLGPAEFQAKLTPRTKAVIAVDYAGQPCDYDALGKIARHHDLTLLSDACHSLGASFRGRPVGTLAVSSVFSLHPAKAVAAGEGGMITTNDVDLARRMRSFRQHGITADRRAGDDCGGWFYEQLELGFNYRLTDLQSALGLSQLGKLPRWLKRRREIARRYDAEFGGLTALPAR